MLYGDESHELKKESFEEEKKDNLVTPPTASEYIFNYKSSLLDYMMTQYKGKMPLEDLKIRVEKIFPTENFYFY